MVLLLGNKGVMGTRYQKILKRLGVPIRTADIEFEKTLDIRGIDRVLIATPTQTHYRYIKYFASRRINILCEKPVCTSHAEITALQEHCKDIDFRVVCNWSYVLKDRLLPESNSIQYHNISSGSDGLAWDCIQLLYLSENFKLELETGVPWDIKINGKRVSPKMIEDSYYRMIRDWLLDPKQLWDMTDAVKQTCKCETYIKEKSCL